MISTRKAPKRPNAHMTTANGEIEVRYGDDNRTIVAVYLDGVYLPPKDNRNGGKYGDWVK